jgi:hypothetical protein
MVVGIKFEFLEKKLSSNDKNGKFLNSNDQI